MTLFLLIIKGSNYTLRKRKRRKRVTISGYMQMIQMILMSLKLIRNRKQLWHKRRNLRQFKKQIRFRRPLIMKNRQLLNRQLLKKKKIKMKMLQRFHDKMKKLQLLTLLKKPSMMKANKELQMMKTNQNQNLKTSYLILQKIKRPSTSSPDYFKK